MKWKNGIIVTSLLLVAGPWSFASQLSRAAGTLRGQVVDPSGGAVPNAVVEIRNPVTGFRARTATDVKGNFEFGNIPPNRYHLTVTKAAFKTYTQDVDVSGGVPVMLSITLQLEATSTTVTVEASSSDLLEAATTAHTDVGSTELQALPMAPTSSALSSVVTHTAPGVVADSNGMFHPLGEHADTTFVIDNQPVSDQQSRIYSNQIPENAVQSLEIETGIPTAEYGDKSSLTANVVTRSALGQKRPTGQLSLGYGSFGTGTAQFSLGLGGRRWGNFLAATGMQTGRFLDTPEWRPIHAKGNSEGVFDRIDLQRGQADSIQINLFAGRSWFQVPNTYDQLATSQDQRQLVRSWNFAPSWTHLFGSQAALVFTGFVRQDRVGYFPSQDPFADRPATFGQNRRLTNAGLVADYSYVWKQHNLKLGGSLTHTFLTENFRLGITDPTFNPVCLTATGEPVTDPQLTNPSQCTAAGYQPNPQLLPGLVAYDLTRGGSLFTFFGHTDIKQFALYGEDKITLGSWTVNAGLRWDGYRGLSRDDGVQPRLAVSYLVRRTGTVLRLGYARIFETPYNENLVLSSATGSGGLAANVFGASAVQPLRPGTRNQFNAGFQQALGSHWLVDGEYFWKFTHTDFDFDTLFDTPLAFPIEWYKSKIDGLSVRINFAQWHGLSAFSVLGHVRARFFPPETGGLIFNSAIAPGVFRIDHDQAFEQTTSVIYQFPRRGPWLALTWRYDSGMVAGAVPDFAAALALDADQQAVIGLYCGDLQATLSRPLTPQLCAGASRFGAHRVVLPAPGTYDPDHNPARIAPRHLLDASLGFKNLFRIRDAQWNLRLTVANLSNNEALYNFLSTFSGTHFVEPRSYSVEMDVDF